MVSVVLLAAGKAKRMGKLKQLMPLGTSTIIEKTVDNLLGSSAGEVIVVLGHKAEDIKKKLATSDVKITFNPLFEKGMGTSIAAGLKLVDSNAKAVMLTLADQPFIKSQTIDKLIKAFEESDKGIVIPVYQDKPGHPIIFSLKYKAELEDLSGDIGGREIIKRHPEDVLIVAIDDEGVIIDIDTMDSYSSPTGGK